jgi:formate-dependent nitrite reductase cytochrome c552 subunit
MPTSKCPACRKGEEFEAEGTDSNEGRPFAGINLTCKKCHHTFGVTIHDALTRLADRMDSLEKKIEKALSKT